MRIIILLTCLLFFFHRSLSGQTDSLSASNNTVTIFNAGPKIKTLTIDLSNPEEAELVLKKIHTFRYLESITLDGEVDEVTLKKLFFRVSVIKNLTNLVLRESELTKIPENISGLRNLQSLTIEGNTNLDYTDLFSKLKSLPITELNLIDNDLKKAPSNLSQLGNLKKIMISGSNQLDYSGLVDQLAKIYGLTTLSIPVNYISELPKNIEQLKSLQVLDVSNNNLSELPGEISALKAINNLSIQGNLLLDPAKDLENLKGNTIQYLALDKEISGEDLEQIKKMFPTAQIDFPANKEENLTDSLESAETKTTAASISHNGELKAKKESRLLSGAYALYPALFQPIVYSFDTLTFEERYKDFRYDGVYQAVRPGIRIPPFQFRKSTFAGEYKGKRREIWFRLAMNVQSVSINFPELKAFSGMYWVYKGTLSKKQFRKKYLTVKRRFSLRWIFKRKLPVCWSDIRIKYDKNNSLFTIQLKSDTGFSEFNASPVFAMMDVSKSIQTYTRKYILYQKYLIRRAQSFKKQQSRLKYFYDLNYKRIKEYAWKELQVRMSDEEKLMDQETWLEYYDNIIANEEQALANSSLETPYIFRALALKGYLPFADVDPAGFTSPTRNLTAFYRNQMVNVDFINADGSGKLAVSNIYVVDTKNKLYYQSTGTLGLLPNAVSLQQFASYRILVQMRNGNWGFVSSEIIDKQNFEPNKTYTFKTQVFDKNLDTIGSLLQSGLN